MNPFANTIAAVSTPRGKGGVAVIRISGDRAFDVAEAMFLPGKNGGGKKPLRSHPPRTAVFGVILDAGDDPVDEGLATLFPSPASFTGEDVAEIACHGGPAATEAVLLSALAHGAEMAGPGEFTRRAFLNGKLSLTEAEAVGRLIDADTPERLALSAGGVRGNVSREIGRISDSLRAVMAALYAAIDYPDEDVGDEGEREIGRVLDEALRDAERLLSTYRCGRAVADGVRTVISGRPNVGKSSLFNLMTGEESAIVTEIAGTTRDILRETVSFGGVTLRLADTAGLREGGETVESVGIERARREIAGAELILAVFDASMPLTPQDGEFLALLSETAGEKLAVLNKADLAEGLTAEDLRRIGEVFSGGGAKEGDSNPSGQSGDPSRVIRVSAASGDGGALAAAIGALFGRGEIDLSRDAVIWDLRHRAVLARASSALREAHSALTRGDPVDCVCTLTEEAMAALDETDGRAVEEGIVEEIFRRFCVGK